MSFEPPDGILDIGNATLRVGKLEVAETSGLNQGLQNIIKNDLLITENTTYAVNHKWGLKLPTTWVGEFEVKGHSGKYIDFNFYNENSASNAQGYNLTFKDTTMTLRYDGGNPLGGGAATIPTIVGAFRKVNIFFERGVISVSIDGTQYLYHKETDGYNQGLGVASRVVSTTGSAFVNLFIEQDAANSAFKNLRIVNDRFISDKTSNIAFIGGNLGVGVNSPQETLDIRGNMHLTRVSNVSQIKVSSNVVAEYTGPHDRPLRKYPEVALTADAETASGYKGYKVTASDDVDNNSNLDKFRAFNGITGNEGWASDGNKYTFGTGVANVGGDSLGNVEGQWLKLQLPLKIKLSHIKLTTRDISSTAYPKDFQILGSNDDSNWTQLINVIDAPYTQHLTLTHHVTGTVDSFQYLAVVVTKTYGATGVDISELEYYGHEEGDSSLDTTLKSVYNVPATTGTQLEVYYDAKDLTEMPATVTDLAGGDQNGTPGTGVSFDSTYKAFVFDGTTTGVISNELPSTVTGAYVHSMSLWFKHSGTGNTLYTLVHIGDVNDSQSVMSDLLVYDTGKLRFGFYDNDSDTPDGIITLNQWYHVVATYSGGTGNAHSRKIYVNGKEIPLTLSGASNANSLSLPSDPMLYLGSQQGSLRLTGSIANFRLYSKALNADQVKELYDYQKDYFLGSKSQVTLYKGHLGIGVTEPSGQLELAGDERIQEYPPGPMSANESVIAGHGIFKARSSPSSVLESRKPWAAFNKTSSGGWDSSQTAGDDYSASDGSYIGADGAGSVTLLSGGGTYSGEFLEIELPYPIKLKTNYFQPQQNTTYGTPRFFREALVLGSNNGHTWDTLQSISETSYSYTYASEEYLTVNTNSETYYKYFRVAANKVIGGTNGTRLNINQWRLFGTPGPTTLNKGSLTLGRSLDVPRISRYDVDTETPRPEKLVLDFDTTVNSSPTDISGKGNHGAFYGTNMNYSSADKAFVFNGSDDYINTSTGGSSLGNFIHSVSMWIYNEATTNARTVFFLGDGAQENKEMQIQFNYTNNIVYLGTQNSWLQLSNFPDFVNRSQWHHIAYTYNGTNTLPANTKFYIDGKQMTLTGGGSGQLNFPSASERITIGAYNNASNFWDGKVSNFKLYSVALEPSEAKKLYNLGRTGRSMVISDTAVGIGKAPEAQLDVRGRTYSTRMEAQSMLVRSRNNLTWTSASQPWDGGGLTIAREEYPLDTTGARYWQFNMHSNYNLHISSNGRYTVWINQNAGNNALNFTGQHRCFIKDVPFTRANELEGLIVSSDQNKYIKMNNGIEKGSNAITTNESLPIVSLSKTHWDKKCFGVISASEDPENRTEQYGAFGSFFEKEEGDTRVYINSVGEGAIWVANTNGSLEAGDYISTSDISGYGQRQGSDYLKNYTVAKITMDCDFSPVSQPIEVIRKDEDGKNILDAHGQIQWENHTTETEKAYKIRYLDASGAQTDESNAVHIAAFVGCTYHCG